ncbi:MAG: hypothetical protein ACKOPO_12305 [Novosphingobium sp.]
MDRQGRQWLPLADDHVLHPAIDAVEVRTERRRWMAAPEFSLGRFAAKPAIRPVGFWRALLILLRRARQPHDDVAERLNDIEALILGGHGAHAAQHIARLRQDHPDDATLARVLGLMSLNHYDLGEEDFALFLHEFALRCGSAHPAMIEIFGEDVPDRWADSPKD